MKNEEYTHRILVQQQVRLDLEEVLPVHSQSFHKLLLQNTTALSIRSMVAMSDCRRAGTSNATANQIIAFKRITMLQLRGRSHVIRPQINTFISPVTSTHNLCKRLIITNAFIVNILTKPLQGFDKIICTFKFINHNLIA